MNCSDFFKGAEVVLNDRGATIKIFDDNGGLKEMSISGIGAVGYPVAGYEARRTQKNTAGSGFAGQMGNVRNTQSKGITLYISNPEDGEAIGSMGDHDSSVTVYKTKDFDPANPVYKVKAWDAAGNVTERMVDISKVDPNNCDEIEMFAYSSHLTASGKCPAAQKAFMGRSPTMTAKRVAAVCLIRETGWILLRRSCRCSSMRAT